MKDVLFILLILAAWISLSRWILPSLGIPTCMSGSCSTAFDGQSDSPTPPSDDLPSRPSDQ